MTKTMTDSFAGFEARCKRIDQNRSRLAQGVRGSIGKDGLIVFRPVRRQRSIPMRAVIVLMVGFFAFKGLVLAHVGEATYGARIDALKSGTAVEQAGAFMMQADPVTGAIAGYVRPYLP